MYIFVWLTAMMYVNIRCEEEKVKRLSAVTNFPELENLYLQIRQQGNQPASRNKPGVPSLDALSKEEICQRVSQSGFFRMNHRHPFSPLEKSNRRTLQLRHPKIYFHLFKLGKTGKGFMPRSVYVNESKPRKIYVKGIFYEERVFYCLALVGYYSPIIKEYYISDREYNVSENQTYYKAGRFIFWYDKEDLKRTSISALVEEAATVVSENVASTYAASKAKYLTIRSVEEDPICRLSKGQKMRLCSIVLNGLKETFEVERKTEFFPSLNHITTECEKRMILYKNGTAQQRTDEFTISCRTQNSFTHYLFRGYEKNRVFVSQDEGNSMSVKYYAYSIPILL